MIPSLSATSRIIALGLCAFCSLNALAWGPLGHHVVATLAEQQLQPRARQEVAKLLALEPGATLVSISTWADEHRDATTARWHYVNLPRGSCAYDEARDCPRGDCVVRAIEVQLAVLKSAAPEAKRLEALKYLVHFMGDIHQPLHAGFGDDRGGNQYQVSIHGKGSNLHALWDFDVVNHVGGGIGQWIGKAATMAPPAVNPAASPAQIAGESCEIVNGTGFYPPHRIPDDYLEQQSATVLGRVQAAGARLAGLLNGAWP